MTPLPPMRNYVYIRHEAMLCGRCYNAYYRKMTQLYMKFKREMELIFPPIRITRNATLL
jgi:hypothetical protein